MTEESALRASRARPAVTRPVQDARWLWDARLLPRSVAWFYLRAAATAARLGDSASPASAMAPRDLAKLLEIIGEQEEVVELGTGGAWSAIALALSDDRRRVTTFDPVVRIERVEYLELVRPSVRARINFRPEPFEHAPRAVGDRPLVLVDGSRGEEDPVVYLSAEKIARPGGIVVVHSHGDRAGNDVIDALFADTAREGGLLVWRKPAIEEPPVRRGRLRSVSRLAAIVLAGLTLGGGVGAAISLWNRNDESGPASTTPPVLRTPSGRAQAAVPSPQAQGRGQRAGRSRPGAGRFPRGLSGRGTTRIGTLNIDQPSLVTWQTAGKRLTISSGGSRLNRPRKRGSTLLSPGSYTKVRVRTTGRWALTIKPRSRRP